MLSLKQAYSRNFNLPREKMVVPFARLLLGVDPLDKTKCFRQENKLHAEVSIRTSCTSTQARRTVIRGNLTPTKRSPHSVRHFSADTGSAASQTNKPFRNLFDAMLEVLRTRARVLLAAFRRGTHELYTETPKPTRRYRRKCFVTPGGALF